MIVIIFSILTRFTIEGPLKSSLCKNKDTFKEEIEEQS